MDRFVILGGVLLSAAAVGCGAGAASDETDVGIAASAEVTTSSTSVATKASLGRTIFFDTNLSSPAGQSCASCHAPGRAFTDPDTGVPTSEGAIAGRFGNRNTPTAAYARFSPPFHLDSEAETYVGGQFWDGRASSLEDQAKGPFLNPIEMNNADPAAVVGKVQRSSYAATFRRVYGSHAFDDVTRAYNNIADAIATYERTETFGAFTSKYDKYLDHDATLTAREARGLALFEDPAKGNCSACHTSRPAEDGTPPMFTDFTYDNLGIPKNPSNPFYGMPTAFNPEGAAFVDRGLGGALGDPAEDGKFKVPTLRNLSRTGPYTHAGYFTTLRSLVEFYNSRDVNPYPAPEVPSTVNHDELGNLGLTSREVDDIVAFLGTLTDGYGD